MTKANIFSDSSPPPTGERLDTLLLRGDLRIERIISSASSSSVEYLQPQDEWVILLRGAASMEVAGQSLSLAPGDYIFLPAGTPHSVLWTEDASLWLAIHSPAAT